MPASFAVTFCPHGDTDHVFQSPSQITVDCYRSGRIGIGGDTQTVKVIYQNYQYINAQYIDKTFR